MGPEVLVVAFILYVLGDTATKGKLTAIMKGGTKGAAVTTARAAKAGTARALEEHRTYLASGKAPLGRARLRAGKVARGGTTALTRGALDGMRAELEHLRTAIDAARAEAEQARASAQDPAQGVTRGKFGHSFDVAPAQSGTGDDVQPRSRAEAIKGFSDYADAFDAPPKQASGDSGRLEAPNTTVGRCPNCRRVVNLDVSPDGVVDRRPPLCEQCKAEQQQDSSTPYGPDATAPGTTPEGITDMGTMTTATAGSGGAHVEVRSLPGFISACESIAQLIDSVSEQATGFGLKPQAQTGLVDAGDTMRAVAASARATYQALIEAADATPQGAEDVTVGAAKTE